MRLPHGINCLFVFFGIGLTGASIYHLIAALDATAVPSQSYEEHVFWTVADLVACYFLVKRPPFFAILLAVWVGQQLHYHGGLAVEIWMEQHYVSLADTAVVIFMPSLLVTYWYDVLVQAAPKESVACQDLTYSGIGNAYSINERC